MKNKYLKLTLLTLSTIAILTTGCSSDSASLKNADVAYAQFVESGVDDIAYSSTPLSGDLNASGSFGYLQEHPVTFSIGDFDIGSVSTVNSDGYVFLQDILGLDREAGLKNQGLANLSRILLAINDNDISLDPNLISTLNNFDVKNKSELDVTALIASSPLLDNVTQSYALNHVAYYYNLIKKAPVVDAVSRITSTLCIDINSTTVASMLTNDNKLKKVDVYLDDVYQGTITNGTNLSRFPVHIELDGASNIDKEKTYKVTFKTDKTRTDTIDYVSSATTFSVPSPMLGRWVDSQTREIVYLKEESELSNYEFKDINQLKDTTTAGRYLLRAGIGHVNLFGTIKKLSTTNAALGTLDMLITHVDSNISMQYRLALKDANNSAGSVITNDENLKVLYVDGNTTQMIMPEILDVHVNDIQALTGKTEIYIRETTTSSTTTSLFEFENIQDTSYDLGTLNLTDSTINYNLVSKFKEGNEYIYYGYDATNFLDKSVLYSKTLEVCNNGSTNISAATFSVTNDNPTLFKTFTADLSALNAGFVSNSCQDIPVSFSFNKPTTLTDANITLSVSAGSIIWEDHQRLKVSDETFVKLYFLSSSKTLNNFIYVAQDGVLLKQTFDDNRSTFIKVPRLASIGYQIAVSPQDIDTENPFLVGTDAIPNPTDWKTYVGKDDNETANNTYTGGQTSCANAPSSLGAQTLALRYGEALSYINFEDIDYFTLDQIPALFHKYSSFETNSSISTKKDIVLPFYIKLVNADTSNIKVFDSNNNEVNNLTISYSDANQSVTILDPTNALSQESYSVKILAGLKSDANESITQDQVWDVVFKSTSMIATGQETSYITNDDASYKSGVSMVQIRDNDNNTTTDINTKLIWQDDNNSDALLVDYIQARNYCQTLSNTASSSWRLPTRDELLTLVNYTQSNPSTDSAALGYIVSNGQYWTSTAVAGDTTAHWYVDFSDGESSFENEDLKNNVRCVIDSADTNGTNFYLQSSYIRPASSEFVTDTNATYLLWQDDESVTNTFENAITYCENLILEDENGLSYTDWRLPNIKELTTIIDDTVSGSFTPAVQSKFINTAANLNEKYWTSTTLNSYDTKAWSIGFEYGTNTASLKTDSNYIRCVSRGSK